MLKTCEIYRKIATSAEVWRTRGFFCSVIICIHIPAIIELKFKILHPPNNPDIAASDYHMFGSLKKALHRCRFAIEDEVKDAVYMWLRSWPKIFLCTSDHKACKLLHSVGGGVIMLRNDTLFTRIMQMQWGWIILRLIHYTFITDVVRKVINKFALLFDSALCYYGDQIKDEEKGVEFGMCRAEVRFLQGFGK